MSELPMPSDVLKASDPSAPDHAALPHDPSQAVGEPPSVKLIVRLFVIPLFIVAVAVGVMFLISLLAGGTPSMEEALNRLKSPGGNRTAEWLVGPASKQRYMDAKTLVDKMKAGMGEAERIRLVDELVDVLQNHTRAGEGEIRHFLLLALGRSWQKDPGQPEMNSDAARASRLKVLDVLSKHAADPEVATRKAALLATVYLAGQPEVKQVIPLLVEKVSDPKEDLDARMAAATALGPIATPGDAAVIEALQSAMREGEPRNAELEWSAALSLAQLGQTDVAPTILKLLSREELAEMRYYDRESDEKNPAFRPLNDQEQQRILINTMIGARNLPVPEVQQQLKKLAESDPSPRVRAAGRELLAQHP
jgi:HEAT repeat protein